MNKRFWLIIWMLLSVLTLFLGERTANAQGTTPTALLLTADGPLTPSMLEYLKRGVHAAEMRGDELLIFQLNTPGGEVMLMNRIVQVMRGSRIPIVVYIAPRGAIAAIAGKIGRAHV